MTVEELQKTANLIRQDVIKMIAIAGAGHPAGCLGVADIFTALYFSHANGRASGLNLDPINPWREDRDRIILSAGHLCPAWYATLAKAGYFSQEELLTLGQIDSRLQAHPHFRSAPGVENTAGSLGQGMSLAVGIALAIKLKHQAYHETRIPSFLGSLALDKKRQAYRVSQVGRPGTGLSEAAIQDFRSEEKFDRDAASIPSKQVNLVASSVSRVICITSDAELQEGQAWEAAMAAAKWNLDNLTFITDRNNIQIGGSTETEMPLSPLAEKIGAFGFHVLSIDGNNISQILNALQFDLTVKRKPVWIIANTVPGRGVSFMEGDYKWHARVPNKEEMEKAIEELKYSTIEDRA